MRSHFDEQLDLLHKELITMGSLCESAIELSAKGVIDNDLASIKGVSALALQINQKEKEIENMCLKLLLLQQPVASDLRVISSALKMITDMERIGHQSLDIAEIFMSNNIGAIDADLPLQKMAGAIITMVTKSIDAFVKHDAEIAQSVIEYDDIVDEDFNIIKQMLLDKITTYANEREYALDILMIAKYFERIGDHAVNIANWVLFAINGNREV